MKISTNDILQINIDLKQAGKSQPIDIKRSIRDLDVLNFWKATEFRTFLLKTGPIVLNGKLSSEAYNHF